LARALRFAGWLEESKNQFRIADELRLTEQELLRLFEDVVLARQSQPSVEDYRRFAELCQKLGMARLAREWARFALSYGVIPAVELLPYMPLRDTTTGGPPASSKPTDPVQTSSREGGHAQ
jgi:hypothetical protein